MIFITTPTETCILNEDQISLLRYDKKTAKVTIRFNDSSERLIQHVSDLHVTDSSPIDWHVPEGQYASLQAEIDRLNHELDVTQLKMTMELEKANLYARTFTRQTQFLTEAVGFAVDGLQHCIGKLHLNKPDLESFIEMLINELNSKLAESEKTIREELKDKKC